MEVLNEITPHRIQRRDLTFPREIGTGEIPWERIFQATYCGGTNVLVKQIHLRNRVTEVRLNQLRNLVNQMPHPNIIQILGICEEPNEGSFVTVCPEEGTLKDYISRVNLTLTEKLTILTKVALGINHLHRQNPRIAHCNIKASSIWITRDKEPKISDFEFSRRFQSNFNSIGCSPSWAAPECLQALSTCTEKVDVYSFAILIVEMMDPRPRLYERLTKELCSRITRGEVRPEISNRDEWPIELLSLVQACWANDPNDRPSVEEIITRLNEIQSNIQPVQQNTPQEQ
ncbi:serine/threonine protein kinase, partial [Thraustotheca clavata]